MKKIYVLLLLLTVKYSFAQTPTNKLDPTGNVGVGTTSPFPSYILDVQGTNQRLYNLSGSAFLRIEGNGSSSNSLGSYIYLNAAATRVGDTFNRVSINANRGSDSTANFQLVRMNNDNSYGLFYQYSDPLGHRFFTAASRTANSTTEVMRVSPEGRIGVGTVPLSNSVLALSTPLSTGNGNIGIFNNGVIRGNTGGTAHNYLYYSQTNTQSAVATTLPLVAHFTAVQGTVDSNTTIAAQTAFWASNSLTKGNHIHGFRGSILLGTNNWNLYMDGDANNFMAGNLGIGTSSPQSPLHINKAINTTGVGYGVYANGMIQNNVTTANIYSSLAQTVSTTALASLIHFNAQQGTVNASGASQIGFNVSQTLNTGTVYGFRGQVVNASNRWNLYMDGSAANYLNGNLGIGTLNPTEKLHITGNILTSKIGFNNDIGNYFIGGISNGMEYRPYSIGKFNFISGNGTWLFENGNVAIGTSTVPSGYKVAIAGNMIVEKIKVKKQVNGAWPDYVFSPSYKLQSLDEVEKFTKEHSHLPEIPSAKEIEKEGQDLGEMNRLLLKKVEELTLYLIEERKTNREQAAQLKQLQEERKTSREQGLQLKQLQQEINQLKKNLR